MQAEHIAGHGQLGETQTAAVDRDDTKHHRRAVAEPPVELVADAGMQCLRGERIDGDRPPAQVGERTAGHGQVDGASQANRIYPLHRRGGTVPAGEHRAVPDSGRGQHAADAPDGGQLPGLKAGCGRCHHKVGQQPGA